MFKRQLAHICALTSADIDTVKSALEIILGDDIKPTHRLEIFARLAGYRTYAALQAEMTKSIDIHGDPLPALLYNSPRKNDPFIASLPLEIRRRLVKRDEIGILRMVAAALRLSRDAVFGDIGVSSEDIPRIEELARSNGFRPWSPPIDGLLPAGPLLILASPENVASLKAREGVGATEPETVEVLADWHLGHTMLPKGGWYFEPPKDFRSFAVDDLGWLSEIERSTTFVFFSDADRDAFMAIVASRTGRQIDRRKCVSVKRGALELQDEADGSFFSLGYYGAANNDLPASREAITGPFAVNWLSDIVTVVHGVASELPRLAAKVNAA